MVCNQESYPHVPLDCVILIGINKLKQMKIENREIKTVNGEKIMQITTTDERWYLVNGKYLPSVTYILHFGYPKSAHLIKWIAEQGLNEAEAIKKSAGLKGSRIHHAIESLLLGNEVKIDDKFTNEAEEPSELTADEYEALMSFKAWYGEFKPEVLGIEYVVVNEKEGYAGSVDLKCKIKGETWIVDFKTGQNVWPEHALQLSAYKACDPEVQKIGILQVGYKRNKNKFKFTEMEDKFGTFLSAKNIWANEMADVSPLQRDFPMSIKLLDQVSLVDGKRIAVELGEFMKSRDKGQDHLNSKIIKNGFTTSEIAKPKRKIIRKKNAKISKN